MFFCGQKFKKKKLHHLYLNEQEKAFSRKFSQNSNKSLTTRTPYRRDRGLLKEQSIEIKDSTGYGTTGNTLQLLTPGTIILTF